MFRRRGGHERIPDGAAPKLDDAAALRATADAARAAMEPRKQREFDRLLVSVRKQLRAAAAEGVTEAAVYLPGEFQDALEEALKENGYRVGLVGDLMARGIGPMSKNGKWMQVGW